MNQLLVKFPRRGTSTNRHEEKKIAVSLEYVDEFALTQLKTEPRIAMGMRKIASPQANLAMLYDA